MGPGSLVSLCLYVNSTKMNVSTKIITSTSGNHLISHLLEILLTISKSLTPNMPGNCYFCIATTFEHQSHWVPSDHVLNMARNTPLDTITVSSQELCCPGRRSPAEEHPWQDSGILFHAPESSRAEGWAQHTARSKGFSQLKHPKMLSAATSLRQKWSERPKTHLSKVIFLFHFFYRSCSNWEQLWIVTETR